MGTWEVVPSRSTCVACPLVFRRDVLHKFEIGSTALFRVTMGVPNEKSDGLTSHSEDRVDVEHVGAPRATDESFAHLDEKAILRKVRSSRG